LLAVVAVAAVFRGPLLRAAGRFLVVVDTSAPAEIAFMTADTGPGGRLELADLFAARAVNRVGVLSADPTPAVRESIRRGVPPEDPRTILAKLGVPPKAIVIVPAGEGGTTDSAAALARWMASNGMPRVVVVTSATHSRRLRRALGRTLPDGGGTVLIHAPRVDPFRPSDWWRRRSTRREGIVELQKLLFDYVTHPLG
jgi:uncharacterized SAM-binding protein YcdF (DUF218 family)